MSAADPADPREPGAIELAVADDIHQLGALAQRPGRRVLAQLALKMARALDVRGDEEAPSQTAKAVDTLRILMNQLTSGDSRDPETANRLGELLGTPTAGGSAVPAAVRDAPESR